MGSCPDCEAPVDKTDNFCRSCGAELPTSQTKTYPKEASPMFGGETWTEAGGGSEVRSDSGGRETRSGERSESTSDDQMGPAGTFPPESSPMFGGETWTMPTSEDADDEQSAEVQPPTSPMGGNRGRDAIRNMFIYAAFIIGGFGMWYFYF